MSEITDDEFSVLGIAKEGQSMIPIGRWEKPIKSLAEKGLLHANDSVNYVITDAGRQAWASRDSEDDVLISQSLNLNNKIANARLQSQQSIEQAAQAFATAARATALLTGETPQSAARNWSKALVERTLSILDG